MVDGNILTVIREQFDAPAALQSIQAAGRNVAATVERKLVYPYYRFNASCRVPTLIGKQHLSVECLVDGINGLGATADPFSTDRLRVPEEVLLKPGISKDEAAKIAQRTVTHQLGRKLRMIAPFDVSLASTGIVYRSFWIVRIGGGRIMIDSVTGCTHPLSASAV